MDAAPVTQNRRATRSSLACLPCRSRHAKCDGKRPSYGRCLEVGNQCSYARSRRGGLDRAALAERRKRMASAVHADPVNHLSSERATTVCPGESTAEPLTVDVHRERDVVDIDQRHSSTDCVLPAESAVPPGTIENDPLIDSYYKNFHICHPFILPRKHLARRDRDPSRQHGLIPLVAALRFIGNIYNSRQWSTSLKDDLEISLSLLSPSDPVQVPCRILYSVALFWYDYKTEAKKQMDQAAQLAIDLQMFRPEFAASQGADDHVQRESWRRTWWMLYILDAYYAGTLGTMNFRVMNIDVTAELPCDESDYESGSIPTPKTFEEFNNREFLPTDAHFSSFAYLIGAVQCATAAIAITPKVAAVEDSTHLIQAVDCSLDGWLLLLPPERKHVIDENGEIDELMFQAHLLIHISTVGLHRPLSALKFNAIENVSSCAREPQLDTPTPDLVNVHTARVLRAAEAQIRLLALPVRRFHHTPFTTCMVSEGTLALLSACSGLFKGKGLAIARDQIRMTLGCLKVLGEVWPRTARNVREIQTIAQCVLGLGQAASHHSTPGSNEVPGPMTGEGVSHHAQRNTGIFSERNNHHMACNGQPGSYLVLDYWPARTSKKVLETKLSARSSEEVQQLVSPPASLADYTFGEMSSTPKRPRLDDLDATPRPGISTPSDRLSRSAFETSSTASRTPSTRRQMMSLRLNELGVECKALDVDAAPEAAQELVSRMEDIGRALYILPHPLQSTILEKLKCRNLEARKWMHSFKDAGDEDRLPGRIPTFEEVEKIHRKANECQEYNHEETSWNSQVHLRLLESIYEEPFGGQCGLFIAITCTTARPHRQFKPASSPFKMIDIRVYAAFEADAELSAIIRHFCGVTPTQTVNHTDFEPLSARPILISIETKKPGVHWDTAQLQIGSLHAAQWSFLRWAVGQRILRQRAEKEMGKPLTDEEEQALEADKLATLSTLGVLPGIIVQGHRWLLVLSTYEDGKTKLWADHQFGTTQSCLEIYAVVAGVRQLTAWARDIYIPWFRANILN